MSTSTIFATVTVHCNLCGASSANLVHAGPDRLLGHPGQFRLVQCRHCGLVYLNPRPADIAPFYAGSYLPFATVPRQRWRLLRSSDGGGAAKGYLELVRQATPRTGGQVLDIGCATGDFLVAMREAGWEVAGCDQSAPAIAYARTRPELVGQRLVAGTVEAAAFAPRSFDLVTMWHTIEHLPDPLATLRSIRTLLRPNGVLLVQTPALLSLEARLWQSYWSGFDCPRHLYVFSNSTLSAMLARAGFAVQQRLVAPSYYMWLVSLLFWLRDHTDMATSQRIYQLLGRGPCLYGCAPFFRTIDRLGMGSHLTLSATVVDRDGDALAA